MKRSELRRLIIEELNRVPEGAYTMSGGSFSGGNHGDHAPTTRQVMDQMSGDAEDEINDAMEKEMSSLLTGPIQVSDVMALVQADRDTESSYKMSEDFYGYENREQLSDEEKSIILQSN